MPVRNSKSRQTKTIKREQEIVSLKEKGLRNIEIAKLLSIHESTVYDYLKAHESHELKINHFQTKLPLYLSSIIAKLVSKLSQSNLDKMSPYQLVGMISMLIDKHRLITGQSTSNQAMLFHIVENACKPTSFVGNTLSSEQTPSPLPLDSQGENILAGG